MEHFVLDRTVLSEEEKQEVLAALQGLNATRGTAGTNIQSKLTAHFHNLSRINISTQITVQGSQHMEQNLPPPSKAPFLPGNHRLWLLALYCCSSTPPV